MGPVSEVKSWFASFTSIGGISQVFASKGLARFYWSILFFVGFGLTIHGLYSVLVAFFKYDVL